MPLIDSNEILDSSLTCVAKKMVTAATTAPKGKGANSLVIKLAIGDTIKEISRKLTELGENLELPVFKRDAQNILLSPVLFIIGTKIQSLGLKKCGMCGFSDCTEKNQHPNVPCVFNTGDLGIALGSAASIACNHRVDNRIMYTVGQAILAMNLLGEEVKVAYAIPLSATSKNPFFDRK